MIHHFLGVHPLVNRRLAKLVRQIMQPQIMGPQIMGPQIMGPQIMGRPMSGKIVVRPARCFASLRTARMRLQAAGGSRRGLLRAVLGSGLRSFVAHGVEREV